MNLRKDGVVDAQCTDIELLAQKKVYKENAVQQLIQKEKNLRELDNELSQEQNLVHSLKKTDTSQLPDGEFPVSPSQSVAVPKGTSDLSDFVSMVGKDNGTYN